MHREGPERQALALMENALRAAQRLAACAESHYSRTRQWAGAETPPRAPRRGTLAASTDNSSYRPARADKHPWEDEATAEWLEDKSVHTQRAYRRHVDHLCAFLERRGARWYAGVRYLDLLKWRTHVLASTSKSTRQPRVAAIKSLFKSLAQGQHISTNPAAHLRMPPRVSASGATRYLTPAQVERAFAAARGPVEVGLLAACYYGMLRKNEVRQLATKDCTWVTQQDGTTLLKLHVYGKGRDVKERDVVLGKDGTRLLKPLVMATTGHLFVGMRGPLSSSGTYKCIKRVLVRAGLSVASPHWLRHAGASHAFANGASLAALRDMLGHADLQVTSKYVHSNPNSNKAALALDKN